LALGNPEIMNLINQMKQHSVAHLEHESSEGFLLVYRIIVRDGKSIERNGRIVIFLIDKEIKEINPKELWEFRQTQSSIRNFDTLSFSKQTDTLDNHIEKLANDLISYTHPRLYSVENQT